MLARLRLALDPYILALLGTVLLAAPMARAMGGSESWV